MELTQEILKELLHYDPETGIFTWKERDVKWFKSERDYKAWNTMFAGCKAGSVKKPKKKKSSYNHITIFNKRYGAHRLVVLYMTGKFPKDNVDHIDHDGLNNKWVNLREVNDQDNCRNIPLRNDNTSGCAGIHYSKLNRNYVVQINNDQGIRIHVGSFQCLKSAIIARKESEKKFNYHPNHGRL